ncbi:MAG: hypothetical protein RIQ54_631 [Candidatus Parcubacteria bacterium]|jgi:hypothetical protein
MVLIVNVLTFFQYGGLFMMQIFGDRRNLHKPIAQTMERFVDQFFPLTKGNIVCGYFTPESNTKHDQFVSHRFIVLGTRFSFFPHYCPRPYSAKALILIIFTVNSTTGVISTIRFALSHWILKRRQLDLLEAIPSFFVHALRLQSNQVHGKIGFV